MSVIMPVQSALVPEPEPKSNQDDENELVNVQRFQVAAESSSDDEDIDENELQNAGYEPLSMVEEVDAEQFSSDEENLENITNEPPQRELSVNTDLVKVAMENIHLDEANIPTWAKDISDTAWDDFVKQTISKDSTNSSKKAQQVESSTSSTT